MDRLFFDHKLDLEIIKHENELDLTLLDLFKLKNVFNGRIYIFFDFNSRKKRNFIILETGIIDYILQFDNLISYLDKGNNETFTVSNDYYSNSLNYIYSKENDRLEIFEVNNNLFTIICKYSDFKKAYNGFRKRVLKELIILYPNLTYNKIFIEYFIS
ncbi:translation elongation factor P/translation initiation factor 5A [Chryseobacterium sp. SLBN-27]|uniref:hypothetical protein n=1 Tax=Chryseobacterium sp. SLBN-27 TaxID=3042287 RepID=UPI002864080E|nr:hypothetical protein [Chryseobacterium sp. SLBN-27]MDR6157660.1 translation elongation factor P/translation initiation factor 5A [Chryseobacterium sp. SLBN-27]